jgi:peroxiredoxin
VFPDYSLPDPTGMVRTLSELQGRDPLILLLARGNYCPKEHHQHLELAANHPKVAVAYTRIVTISTDDDHTTQEFRASVGAEWTFLSDTARSTPPETWFVMRRRSPIVRYAESSPREVRKQGPDSAARFPYCGNLLRRRCPGRGSMVPLRQVSTLTCVSPRTAGDGHPHSTPAVPPLSARRCETARAGAPAAVASTVTLRRFRS